MTGKKNRKRLSRYDLEHMKQCRAEAIKRRIEEAKSTEQPESSQPKEEEPAEPSSPPKEKVEEVSNPPVSKDPAKSKTMKAIWEKRMQKRKAQAQRNLAAVRKRCSKPASSETSQNASN